MDKKYKYKNGEILHIGNFHGKIIEPVNKGYRFKCLNCGCVSEKITASISKGVGCPVCCNRRIERGVNDITTTDPWMVPFFQGGAEEASAYSKSSGKRIVPKCPHCGRLCNEQKINAIYEHKGVSCICQDGITLPNKIIFFVMEQLLRDNKIKSFSREYYIKESACYFDIHFLSKNNKEYFVEMDGGIGHGYIQQKHIKSNGKFTAFPSSIFANDAMKDRLAESLGVQLIRIDCYYSNFEYIRDNILNSGLPSAVEDFNVDWKEIEEQSYSNIIANVCQYKRDNQDSTVSDIADEFKLSKYSVRNYLILGNKLGWCVYDKKIEEHRNRSAANKNALCRKVALTKIDTEEEIIFASISEFVKNSGNYFSRPFTKSSAEKRFKKNNDIIENYEGYRICKLRRNEYGRI